MKTLGLIGGTSWVSTAEYYRIINEEVNRKLGGVSSAKGIIYSFNYSEIDELNKANNFSKIGELVLTAAKKLESAGADCIILCANSLHMHVNFISKDVAIPIIHIVDAAAKSIKEKGISKVGLLGTRWTMEKDFYKERFSKSGIEVLIPENSERKYIHAAIMNELIKDKFYSETKQEFFSIIKNLVNRNAQGIVLGCTEIPLLIKQDDLKFAVFNTLELHAKAAVDFGLSG